MGQFKPGRTEAPLPIKPVGRPSSAHICKLWDYRSLLLYRAGRARGEEGRHLLTQADGVVCDIAQCLGKEPSVIKSLNDIGDLKKLFADM